MHRHRGPLAGSGIGLGIGPHGLERDRVTLSPGVWLGPGVVRRAPLEPAVGRLDTGCGLRGGLLGREVPVMPSAGRMAHVDDDRLSGRGGAGISPG